MGESDADSSLMVSGTPPAAPPGAQPPPLSGDAAGVPQHVTGVRPGMAGLAGARVNTAPLLLSLQLRPHTPEKQEAPLGLLPWVDLEPEASSPEGVIPSHRAGIGGSRLTAATAFCCHTVSLSGNTVRRQGPPQPRWPRPLGFFLHSTDYKTIFQPGDIKMNKSRRDSLSYMLCSMFHIYMH